MRIIQTIANELNVKEEQVAATIQLIEGGATIPFIARYRKEITQGLDDSQLRLLDERLTYLRELESRRETIIHSINEQGKLTPELKESLMLADTKSRLEDLYLPYKPKRRTKAQIAREAGLEPLAVKLLRSLEDNPDLCAQSYLNPEKNIHTIEDALEGAKQILMEQFCENADLLTLLRDYTWANFILESQVMKDKETQAIKFKDYFDYKEKLAIIPSHRALALFRGQKEEFLRLNLHFDNDQGTLFCINAIAKAFNIPSPHSHTWLWNTVEWTWKVKLKTKMDIECFVRLRSQAEKEAITVFKENLNNLLMAAPAGKKVTLGLDPAYRTGVKTVVVSDTGKLLAHTVIFPHQPQNQWQKSLATLSALCKTHGVNLISVGNGTASRETDKLAKELVSLMPDLKMISMVVSEAGASVYSASELAAKEFPHLDVSYRGAISIARRLQDPLAELVKIDPKAIGVGQYQHDINQYFLGKGLDTTVEDCVNAVGADVNTASAPLLKSIAGLNESVAHNIVAYREEKGRFPNREALKNVPRFGAKTYEQAIGFLRIIGGEEPLDASALHPESYPVVDQILKTTQSNLSTLMGNQTLLDNIDLTQFITDDVGLLTLKDIISELKKPGRDPRPEFKTAQFKEGIETIGDLKPGMRLEGVATNVTNFGAFIDIGVHQDGLVHISQLSDQYVSDPSKIIKAGQIVQVTVMEVDVARKRIQLTMKLGETMHKANKAKPTNKHTQHLKSSNKQKQKKETKPKSGFANALENAFK